MRIKDLLPLKDLKIFTQDLSAQGRISSPEAFEKFPLVAGQVLKGQVVGFSEDGKVLLQIGDQTIAARSEVALKLGSEFWLEVRQGGNSSWLSLADKKGLAQEYLQEFLPAAKQYGAAIRLLFNLAVQESGDGESGKANIFQQFASLAQGAESSPEKIIRFLSWLGAGQYGKGKALYDGQLSQEFQASFEALAGKQEPLPKSELLSLQRFAALLDLQQQLNATSPSTTQPFSWIFPCFFAFSGGWGQWMIIREDVQEKKPGDQGFTLSFFLEMSRLGELQIQLRVLGNTLQGDFIVAHQEVLSFLNENLSELQNLLSKLGYAPVNFHLRVAQTGMLQELKQNLERAVRLHAVRIVDIQA